MFPRSKASFPSICKATSLAVAFIFSVCFTSYLTLSAGLPGTFLLDDYSRIQSATVTDTDLETLSALISKANSGLFGRPISLASLYWTKAAYGDTPSAFRHENILYHLICTLLVFWFISRLLIQINENRSDKTTQGSEWTIGAALAGAWSLHPLFVSTVLYSVQRMTQLSAIFTLAALILYVVMRQRRFFHPKHALLTTFGIGLFGGAAVLSKENGVLLPCFILLIEFFVFGFKTNDRLSQHTLRAFHSFVIILPIVAGVLYIATHLDGLLHDYIMRDFALVERLATEMVVIWQYIGMLVLPRLSSMTLYHDAFPVYQASDLIVWFAFIGIIALVVSSLLSRKHIPLIGLGILFFLTGHALEGSFLPLELVFEHRNYLPAVGLSITFSAALNHVSKTQSHKIVIIPVVMVFILLLTFMQWTRASMWSDTRLMHTISLQEHPTSVRATSELANQALMEGRIDTARRLLSKIISYNVSNKDAGLRLHLLVTYCFEDSIPDDIYQKTLHDLDSKIVGPYATRGIDTLRQRMARSKCPAITTNQFIELAVAAANNPRTRRRYTFMLRAIVGISALNAGQPELARKYLNMALESPSRIETHFHVQALIKLAYACHEMDDRDCFNQSVEKAQDIIEQSSHALVRERRILRNILGHGKNSSTE